MLNVVFKKYKKRIRFYEVSPNKFIMNKTDSFGNALPKSVFLQHGESWEKINAALAMNMFLLAIDVALSVGKVVNYSKDTKSATITDRNGLTGTINHP